MKAPEKIYICPSELAGIDYEEEWLERPFGDSVEYTRTDAFIEKAVAWFKNNTDITPTGIRNFYKAMKGE